MLTSTDITADERRKSIRELANVSSNSYDDTNLDRKIENGDSLAITFFQVRGITLDGTEDYFRDLIVTSNLLTSSLILMGLDNQQQTAKDQKELAMKIVEAHNEKAPSQNVRNVLVTRGIDS